MGWFSKTLDVIKEQTRHEPIECPRGWGKVSFVGSGWYIPPMAGLERNCPIGGVTSCGACEYASNPDAFLLTDQLGELDRLRDEGQLSADEYDTRRAAVVQLHVVPPSQWQRATAWILGPLGLVIAAAGTALALAFQPGFWAIATIGFVLLALAVGFGALSRPPKQQDERQ